MASLEINFEVSELKNLTSDQSLMATDALVSILYCELNTVTFQASSFSGALDQLVSLKGRLRIPNQPTTDFSVIGKIIGVFDQRITIKMNQYDKKIWDSFIESLKYKQGRVDHLLNSIKGDVE